MKTCMEELETRRLFSAGQIDTTFGRGGQTSTPLPAGSSPFILNVQHDGTMLVAGRIGDQNTAKFILTRLKADGHLDATFGDRGSTTSDFEYNLNVSADGGPVHSTPVSLVTQPDGKVILGGDVDSAVNRYGGTVRFDLHGNIDIRFGNHGDAVADRFGQNGYYSALLRQADGKLIFVGHVLDDSTLAPDFGFAVSRYDAHANIDTSFAQIGATAFHFTTSVHEHASALCGAIQADGKIVAAGYTDPDNSGHPHLAIVRLNTDGSLDGGFGTGGRVVGDVSTNSEADSILVQHNGGLIVDSQGTLLRFTRKGVADLAFNDSAAAHFNSLQVIEEPDGKLLCLGTGNLGRFNADGSADVTFGESGVAKTVGQPFAIGLTPNDDIVAVGASRNRLLISRYQGTTLDGAGNFFSSAKLLGVLGSTQSVSDFVGHDDPADVYRFDLSSKAVTTITLDGLTADANIQLYDDRHQLLGVASRGVHSTDVIKKLLRDGTYFVKVSRPLGVDTGYRLTLATQVARTHERLP